MSEQSSAEKTEQPTDKKRADFREEGKVAKSKELVSTLILIIGSYSLLLQASNIEVYFKSLIKSIFDLL